MVGKKNYKNKVKKDYICTKAELQVENNKICRTAESQSISRNRYRKFKKYMIKISKSLNRDNNKMNNGGKAEEKKNPEPTAE